MYEKKKVNYRARKGSLLVKAEELHAAREKVCRQLSRNLERNPNTNGRDI